MAIMDVIEHAQAAILSSVAAIESAPKYPTDKLLNVVTCNAYAENIHFHTISSGFNQTFFDMRIEIGIPRNDISENMAFLSGIPEAVAAVFTADPTIGGHCSTFDGDVTAELVVDTIKGITVIGYVITVPGIKI